MKQTSHERIFNENNGKSKFSSFSSDEKYNFESRKKLFFCAYQSFCHDICSLESSETSA